MTLRLLTLSLLLALLPLVAQGQDANRAQAPAARPASSALTAQDSLLVYLRHAMLFSQATPPEKVYVHLDNTGYFKGERIWMKAYVTQAQTNRAGVATYVPTTLSRVLYVELLNPIGDVVARRKLAVTDGQAEGDILLDSILGTGFYELRAFTRYMRNWGDGQEFSRVIPIFRKPEREGDYSRPTIDHRSSRHRLPSQRTDATAGNVAGTEREGAGDEVVRFFPEGGDLVVGLPSRVAYTVGNPDSGETERGVTEFTPTTTAPQPFTYTDRRGRQRQVSLPAAQSEGCVMRLETVEGDDVTMRLDCSAALQGRLLAYVLLHNGTIVQCDTFTAQPRQERAFPRLDLPAGVNQLTVFDSQGRIRAERLFFIQPTMGLALDSVAVSADVQALQPCGPVTLTLQTRPHAHLSLSAIDAASLTNGKQGNIATWMLLASDLKGYIENPEYYFEADDTDHRRAADLLMMVQGWRRYDWRLLEGVQAFARPLQPIEDNLYLIGQLKPSLSGWKKKNPVGNVGLTAILYNQAGNHLRGECTTDSLGYYAFQLPDVSGEWRMEIQTRIDDKLKSYNVTINRHFSPAPRYLSPEETQMLEKNEPNLFRLPAQASHPEADQSDGRLQGQTRFQIGDRHFVTATVKVKARRHYWTDYSGGWYNENDARRAADIYYDCDAASDAYADLGEVQPTLYRWLEQKNELFQHGDLLMAEPDSFMTAYTANERDSENPAHWNRHDDGPSYHGRPIVWVLNNKYAGATSVSRGLQDGTYIFSANIERLPTYLDEVKSIYISEDVSRLKYFAQWSELEGVGAVVIQIYTHPTYTTASNKGLRRTYFAGFNDPSTFEMEDYSILPPMADFRRTIYWQPRVEADAEGRASVSFYNNSSARELLLSVEGITPEGVPVAK